MFLKQIKLTNFRNFSSLDFKFKTPITVLYGNNAQGKTNFLESIYFLASARSTRAEQDVELIKEGEEVLRVEGDIALAEEKLDVRNGKIDKDPSSNVQHPTSKLEIAMQLVDGPPAGGLKKRVRVNGLPKRVMDYSQNLAVVYFAPEDINLVKGAPSLRRDHIDFCLSQVDREYERSSISYKKALGKYEDVLIRKNRVLKAIRDEDASLDQLIFWLDQQINFGTIISQKRRIFFEFINNVEKKFGDFEYQYIESPVSRQRLNEYQEREIDAAASLIGPHRDDFRFLMKERDLAHFGSRGEQRTAVLDLKIAEMEFMENILGSRPVLLLDDIFSELDHQHAEHVLNLISLQQTIITAVELDEHIKNKFGQEAKIFKVKEGKII